MDNFMEKPGIRLLSLKRSITRKVWDTLKNIKFQAVSTNKR